MADTYSNPNYGSDAALVAAVNAFNNSVNTFAASEANHDNRKFARQMYDLQRQWEEKKWNLQNERQDKLIADQRAYTEDYTKRMQQYNWDNYESPAAQRAAKLAAGLNPNFSDAQPVSGVSGASPADIPSAESFSGSPSVGMPDLPYPHFNFDASGFVAAQQQRDKIRLDADAAERDRKRLANETKQVETSISESASRIAKNYADIDLNDAQIRQISQTCGKMYEETQSLRLSNDFVLATYADRVQREHLLNGLYKSQDKQLQAAAALLDEQKTTEQKRQDLFVVQQARDELQYTVDKALQSAKIEMGEKELEHLNKVVELAAAQCVSANLQALIDGREIDVQQRYDDILRYISMYEKEVAKDKIESEGNYNAVRGSMIYIALDAALDLSSKLTGQYSTMVNANANRVSAQASMRSAAAKESNARSNAMNAQTNRMNLFHRTQPNSLNNWRQHQNPFIRSYYENNSWANPE